MSIEALFWGIIPTVVAVATVFGSLFMSWKERRITHFITSAIVLIGVVWSLAVLYRIFLLGAWPTFLPHVIIGVALIAFAAQAILLRSRKRDLV